MRTVTVVMTYMLGAALLASLALAGCSKDPAGGTVDPGREAVILSIAEANYGVSGGVRRSGTSPVSGGAPQTRAIVGGNGSTFFTDRDRLGLFLRGDGYEDVDNRIVQLDYPGEGPQKKWNITGEAIPLYADAATVTAYFPYSDVFGLTMSAIPLNSGPYDVNSNDVVWQRDTVHAAHTQAMFLEMQHAMTRVKIRLSGGRRSIDVSDPGDYTGEGKITGVRIADAGDVAADDRVVYLDGMLDLTQATPVVTPGWPDAVADKSEKTLTAEGVLYDLLLLPVDKINAGKVLLEVELDSKVLPVPFPVDAVDKWEAGKAYTYEVLVRNGGAQVVFGKATVTPWNYGGSISGDLTSKPEYGGGDVQEWGDNEWGTVTGKISVGDVVDGGVVYWVNPDDPTDYRVVSLNQAPSELMWAAKNTYVLGSAAQSETERNGAAIWSLAKAYSANTGANGTTGTFATDFPAFDYCYNLTTGADGQTVPKGTWYLPSKQELRDLYAVKGAVEPVITGNGGTAFSAGYSWSATEISSYSSYAWYVKFGIGSTSINLKTDSGCVRCVREK